MVGRCGRCVFILFASAFTFEAALFLAGGDDVANGHFWFDKKHAWTTEAHDGANLFAHIRAVAVDTAIGAEGFVFHEWAMVATCVGVAFEGFTLRTETLFGVMNLFAI